MAYNITLTDGTAFATINDGTVNTASSVTLVGKNYAGYGEFLDENFIQMLENFSSNSSGGNPTVSQLSAPLTGQLWWDKTNALLKVYNGTVWKTISAATSSSTAPTSNVTGDLWYDTVSQQVKVWTGTAFLVVGPAYSAGSGTAGAIPETINDNGGSPHQVTSLYVANTQIAIVSFDSAFTPAAPYNTSFPTLYPGITVNKTIASNTAVFAGNVTNTGNLGLTAGGTTTTVVTSSGVNITGLVTATGNITGGNVNTAGLLTATGNITGGNVNTAGLLTATGNITGGNVNTAGAVNATGAVSAGGNVDGGNIRTVGLITATGNITGGNVTTGGLIQGQAISAVANVQGGNLRTTGLVSATGNITSSGNVAGTYFIGNGSQLTGISAAVSVSFISALGTSEMRVLSGAGDITANVGGVANTVVFGSSSTTFGTTITVPSITKSGSNNVGNIGSTSNWFNQVYAVAVNAQYADVAERFEADEVLDPGTVVELGGEKEITRSCVELSENVFGVISTKPAFTMNGSAGENDTHPAVAMTGRVPVKVIGKVQKGDRLVGAGDGIARSARPGEATSFNVIGRALDNKTTNDVGIVEAIVSIKA